MEMAEMILREVQEIRRTQEATFADLSARLDAIDRATDIPLTLQQAAVFLNCSTQTIANYRNRGLIKKRVRNGLAGYLRIDLEELKKHF